MRRESDRFASDRRAPRARRSSTSRRLRPRSPRLRTRACVAHRLAHEAGRARIVPSHGIVQSAVEIAEPRAAIGVGVTARTGEPGRAVRVRTVPALHASSGAGQSATLAQVAEQNSPRSSPMQAGSRSRRGRAGRAGEPAERAIEIDHRTTGGTRALEAARIGRRRRRAPRRDHLGELRLASGRTRCEAVGARVVAGADRCRRARRRRSIAAPPESPTHVVSPAPPARASAARRRDRAYRSHAASRARTPDGSAPNPTRRTAAPKTGRAIASGVTPRSRSRRSAARSWATPRRRSDRPDLRRARVAGRAARPGLGAVRGGERRRAARRRRREHWPPAIVTSTTAGSPASLANRR